MQTISTIGLGIAKSIFQAHGIDGADRDSPAGVWYGTSDTYPVGFKKFIFHRRSDPPARNFTKNGESVGHGKRSYTKFAGNPGRRALCKVQGCRAGAGVGDARSIDRCGRPARLARALLAGSSPRFHFDHSNHG